MTAEIRAGRRHGRMQRLQSGQWLTTLCSDLEVAVLLFVLCAVVLVMLILRLQRLYFIVYLSL